MYPDALTPLIFPKIILPSVTCRGCEGTFGAAVEGTGVEDKTCVVLVEDVKGGLVVTVLDCDVAAGLDGDETFCTFPVLTVDEADVAERD